MGRVLNIAHRGYTRRFPDNTLEAFEAAIKLGVDGIECDVQETSDARFVIHHDNDIHGAPIAEMQLAQVRATRLAGGFRVPTLEEALQLCAGRVLLNLEIKLVYSLDGFVGLVNTVMAPAQLLVSSFLGATVRAVGELAPEIPRGVLTGYPVEDPLQLTEMAGAQTMLPRYRFLDKALVDRLHASGLRCIVWDCNALDEITSALEWGVDGIITDSPDLVAGELRKED